MNEPVLYRRRLIPQECVCLKDDIILSSTQDTLVTFWKALKPRSDLHHGYSVYYLQEGYKISRFYHADNRLKCHYCDIIAPEYDPATNSLIVTDLLADVTISPEGAIRVLDLNEVDLALEQGLLSIALLRQGLRSLSALLELLYGDGLRQLSSPIERFDPYYTLRL